MPDPSSVPPRTRDRLLIPVGVVVLLVGMVASVTLFGQYAVVDSLTGAMVGSGGAVLFVGVRRKVRRNQGSETRVDDRLKTQDGTSGTRR